MPKRPRIPDQLKNKLLVEAGHTCSICGHSGVQIHHIDGNPANNSEDNLIVLCLMHHDEAEKSKSGKGLSANLSPTALRDYKRRLQSGQGPATPNIREHASKIKADIQNVEKSNIIIAGGDVTTYTSLSSQPAEVEPKIEQSPSGKTGRQSTKPNIGIITALEKEYVAVKKLIENPIEDFIPGRGAGRRYLVGEVPAANGGKHIVALALLADMGNNQAAARATLLLEHFPTVSSIIMVGIAGGIPNPEKASDHVRLGDIVVSDKNGVVQYDLVKEEVDKTIHRNPPRPPSAALLEGVRFLTADELEGHRLWLKFIDQALQGLKASWSRPAESSDTLISSTHPEEVIPHPDDRERDSGQPRVFIGPIASANVLLKNPLKRDALRDKFHVKAVEMEGSGIADATWHHEVGYLVVRGICDYCDSRKNDDWQKYASIVAAAYTRALLEKMPSPNKGSSFDLPSGPVETPDDEKYKLSKLFRPSNEEEEETPSWRPQVDLRKILTDEPDIDYLGVLSGEEPITPDDEQCAAWREQLAIHRRNLNELEKRKAMYGIDAPLHILHQIDEEKAEIKKLEALLGL